MNLLRVVAMTCALAATAAAQTAPAYDAVSVKPNKSGSGGTSIHTTPEVYQATNVSLKSLLTFAYNLQSEDLVSGLPGWTDSARFDIQAKVDAETIARLKAMTRDEAADARRIMMRGMLEDRFKLKAHLDTRQEPIYLLVVAKGGPKFKAADPNDTYANGIKGRDGGPSGGGSMNNNNGHVVAQGVPLDSLVQMLSRQVHRMVVDKTGLTGKYDFTVDFPREDAATDDGSNPGPSLFTVLQETLGLKLEATRGPVTGVVVDHLEQPSEN